MKTIDEIQGAITSFRNNAAWLQKKKRWEEDYDLYVMKPYDAGKGYFSYTSNNLRVFADKLISMLNSAKLRIRIPLDTLDEPSRKTASNIERFAYGGLNLNDERLLKVPGIPSIRQQRAFYAALRGGFARGAYVYKDATGRTILLIMTWDIYRTAYAKGKNGSSWASYDFPMTKEELKEEWGYTTTANEEMVTNFWDDENNGIFVKTEWLKDLKPHGLKQNPVTIHMVGSHPPLSETSDGTTNKNMGESIFKPNRNINATYNRVVSDFVSLVHRGVKVPIGVWSASGEKNLEGDIWQVEKASSVPFKIGEEVKPLIPPGMPADTLPLLQIISGEMQRGSLPHTAYGELAFRLSGFAINQLQGSLETVMEPCVKCLEQAYKMDIMQLIDQYAKEDWSPVQVRGRTSYNVPFGSPKAEFIRPEDLEKEWYPEIELIPVLPKDDAQRHQLAQLARQPNAEGIPVLSDRTIQDEILGVEDTDLEQEKIDQEFGARLRINRLYTAYLAALQDGRPDKAMNVLNELKMLTATMGQGTAKTPRPTQVASMESPGVGLPPQETGVPSSTIPPEAMGGFPGGAMNATQMPPQGGM